MADEKSSFNLNTPTAIIIAGVIIALAVFFTGSKTQNNEINTPDPSTDPNALLTNIRPVSADENILGPVNAPITIIEYSDLECPFCKNFHYTMKDIMTAYPNGEVAWVFRHFPIGSFSQSMAEAEAAECIAQTAGNEAFWGFLDRIYDNTGSGNTLDMSLLPVFAREVGANMADYENCVNEGLARPRVEADRQNASEAGGTGTPFSILIDPEGNHYDLKGAVPFETLSGIIEEMLAEL